MAPEHRKGLPGLSVLSQIRNATKELKGDQPLVNRAPVPPFLWLRFAAPGLPYTQGSFYGGPRPRVCVQGFAPRILRSERGRKCFGRLVLGGEAEDALPLLG